MADNVAVDNGTLADFTVATTDSSSVHYPKMLLVSLASLNAGAQTAVSSSAVQVIAAGTTRRLLILQNVGAGACRIGPSGVTATTGVKLSAGAEIIFDGSAVPTNAVYAIRDGATDTTVLAQDVS